MNLLNEEKWYFANWEMGDEGEQGWNCQRWVCTIFFPLPEAYRYTVCEWIYTGTDNDISGSQEWSSIIF